MKRAFDLILSITILITLSPLLFISIFLVFLEDLKNPIYFADRIGLKGRRFTMFKIRSMYVGAEKTGVESTKEGDLRITKVGKFIRKYKIDELSQFMNVLIGNMSIVGPRPNTISEVKKYTESEIRLLDIKPGVTDIASIVFSNEGEILKDSQNPDRDYNILIRPGKSKLGLFYVQNYSILLDVYIIFVTCVAIFSRDIALRLIAFMMKALRAPENLVELTRTGIKY